MKRKYKAYNKNNIPEDPRPALNCRQKMAAAHFVAVVVVQTPVVAGLLLIAGQNCKNLNTIVIISNQL